MKFKDLSRRKFITAVTTTTVATVFSKVIPAFGNTPRSSGKLAIHGGTPVRVKIWPKWPAMIADDKLVDSVVKTTKSGIWSRIQSPTGTVATFEKEYASLMGTKLCIGTGSGTQALATSVEAMDFGPGDEIITSPYSDFGTVSAILTSRALPVLVDLDRDSFQFDPEQIEKKINKNTKAIIPVHIMGMPCNMEAIMAIARKHNLKVIEDACQSNFAKYQGKQLGTIGDLGCFSFQASKQISCGEGGAIIGNDEVLMDRCFTVQNHGTNRKGSNVTIGPKYRMNEFEGAVLMGQIAGARERFEKRNVNAAYLDAKLKGFPGLVPQMKYPGTESSGYYKYAMSYRKEHFNNVDRGKFLKALSAEGINLSPYIARGFHVEPWVDEIIGLREYKALYSPVRLKRYKEEMKMPICDLVCYEEMVVLEGVASLLGTTQDMDDVINAIMKVYENRDKL